jgi:hypothetical protein
MPAGAARLGTLLGGFVVGVLEGQQQRCGVDVEVAVALIRVGAREQRSRRRLLVRANGPEEGAFAPLGR